MDEELHDKVMDELQREYQENATKYQKQRNVFHGIRSSQISALVGYLIKKGIITEDNV